MLKLQYVALALVLYLNGSLCQLNVCGRAPLNVRCLAGYNASEGAWPWEVSLQVSGRNEGHFCGGTLINENWVLTAASCFFRQRHSVVTAHLGRTTLTGINPNHVTRHVIKMIQHPNYNSTSNNNDIMLLRLHSSVPFSDYIRPVCLAGYGSRFPDNTMSWITGWGNVDSTVPSLSVQQEAMVPIINDLLCTYLLNPGYINETMICAGYISGGPDTCQGDFGGPLVTKLGAAWVQTGITSWGKGCDQHITPSVYTRVSEYQFWISSIIRRNLPGFVRF